MIMKKLHFLIPILATLLWLKISNAQRVPFKDPIYEIKPPQEITYGINATKFPLIQGVENEFVRERLNMDIYEPINDKEERPLVIMVSLGEATPIIFNDLCWGDKTDDVTVATAEDLARRGFVVAAMNPRYGWSRTLSNNGSRLNEYMDAIIRIQQDNKEIVLDILSGVSLMTILLKSTTSRLFFGEVEKILVMLLYWQLTSTTRNWIMGILKFENSNGEMEDIFDSSLGNLDGTQLGFSGPDTTNYINFSTFSANFNLVIVPPSLLLDLDIFEVGEPPLMMYGNPNHEPTTDDAIGPISFLANNIIEGDFFLSRSIMEKVNEWA